MASQATALPGFDVLSASGPDAASFLQGQLASDVRALAPGDWQWSCYLTPQGRTQSVFALFRAGADEFLLAVPGAMAEAVRERLARFRLRSKVELAIDPERRVAGELDVADGAPSVADAHVAAMPGSRRLIVRGGMAPTSDADVSARWRLADIANGVPVLTAAVTDGHTPQALSLARLGAYSVKKGCYPGQEIVARTHFLGRSKRALARFGGASDSLPAPGTELLGGAASEPAGTVISAAAKGSHGFEVLAVVRDGLSSLRLPGSPDTPLEPLPFDD